MTPNTPTPPAPQSVIVVGLDMPFVAMVELWFKLTIAAVPAMLMLTVVSWFFFLLATFFFVMARR
jgi:hypothetical protein